MSTTETKLERITTAPEVYDGFGTQTIRVVCQDNRGRDVRLVSISPEHLDWQEARYGSGLHCSYEVPMWNRLVKAGVESGVEV